MAAASERGSALQGFLTVVGMLFYWPMFRNHYLGVLGLGATAGDFSQTYTLLVFLVALSVFAVVVALRSKRFDVLLSSHSRLVPGISFLASLMAIILVFLRSVELDSPIIGLIAALVLAAHTTVITVAWGRVVAESHDKRIVFYLALAFLLSFVISLCTWLPHPLNAFLPVVGPLASGLSWYFLNKRVVEWQPFTQSGMTFPIMGIVLILVLFLLVGSVVRGLNSIGVMGYLPSVENSLRPVMSIILSLILCLAVFVSTQSERLINVVWIVFVLIFFVGLFITAALLPETASFDSEIVVVSRTFLGFFLWVAIVNVARRQKADPLFLLCVFFLITDSVSGVLTNYFIPFFTTQDPGFYKDNAGISALLMAFVLLLGSFAFLGTRAFSATSPHQVSQRQEPGYEPRREACMRIAESCKLTARETDMLYFISQGHSIKKIAAVLFISTSTVRTHVKSLYRKTDRHTRQEIIDYVNETERADSP